MILADFSCIQPKARNIFFIVQIDNQIIHLLCEVMLWRPLKIKCVLVLPCIGLLAEKYYPLPCQKSHNIFSSVLDRELA